MEEEKRIAYKFSRKIQAMQHIENLQPDTIKIQLMRLDEAANILSQAPRVFVSYKGESREQLLTILEIVLITMNISHDPQLVPQQAGEYLVAYTI